MGLRAGQLSRKASLAVGWSDMLIGAGGAGATVAGAGCTGPPAGAARGGAPGVPAAGCQKCAATRRHMAVAISWGAMEAAGVGYGVMG